MRFASYAAAAIAATVMVPAAASAAVIVQSDSDMDQRGMNSFDSRLGRLAKVTLEITMSRSRAWVITGQIAPKTSISYGYVIDGSAAVSYYNQVDSKWERLSLPIFGEGQGVKSFLTGNESRFITLNFTGHSIFELDPLNFIDTGPRRVFFDPFDPFYYGGATDTHLVLNGGYSAVQASGYCGEYRSGDDFCGNSYYKLTYSYVPASNPAVPEPATWALMILGFGAVGYSMRRKKAVARFT